MPHIDAERLALFALGEPVATPDESRHLADCGACVEELAALRHAAVAGRASFDVGELESPPDIVWTRIAAELQLGASHVPSAPRVPSAEPVVVPSRRAGRLILALAASIVLVAGIALGVWAATQRVSFTEIAEASLAPFPAHSSAAGSAIVEERPDGTLDVRVTLDADAAPDTFREVWLIKGDASDLVSLGVLEGTEQTFAVPAGVDIHEFLLVDVSQEPVGGDDQHSGDSIVRGELAFS